MPIELNRLNHPCIRKKTKDIVMETDTKRKTETQ